MKGRDARNLSPRAQEGLRCRAIRAIIERGQTQAEVVRTLGVSRTALHNWLVAYRDGGAACLESRRRGRPRRPRLTGEREEVVLTTIMAGAPNLPRFPHPLWTREAIQLLIFRQFEMEVSLCTVGRYLKRWGITPRPSARELGGKGGEEMKRWLSETYPGVLQSARKQSALIHWLGHKLFPYHEQTGSEDGDRSSKVGREAPSRLLFTVTNHGQLAFMPFEGRLNTDRMLRFLNRLVRQDEDRLVFLIAKRYRSFDSKKLRSWLQGHRDRIRVFYLSG